MPRPGAVNGITPAGCNNRLGGAISGFLAFDRPLMSFSSGATSRTSPRGTTCCVPFGLGKGEGTLTLPRGTTCAGVGLGRGSAARVALATHNKPEALKPTPGFPIDERSWH